MADVVVEEAHVFVILCKLQELVAFCDGVLCGFRDLTGEHRGGALQVRRCLHSGSLHRSQQASDLSELSVIQWLMRVVVLVDRDGLDLAEVVLLMQASPLQGLFRARSHSIPALEGLLSTL